MNETTRIVLSKRRDGKTYQEIADELGISRQRVHQIFKKNEWHYNSYMDYTLYILRCDNDTYYVGQTSQFPHRMNQHFSGNGARYTQMHKPKSIEFFMTRKSYLVDVRKVESFVQKNMQLIPDIIAKNQDTINFLERIWLNI